VPGLDDFLVSELQLRETLLSPQIAEAEYLAAVSGTGRAGRPLDLRPPEDRFGDRITKPALAAGLCALLIVLGNSFTPRQADAQVARLRPLAEQLQVQLDGARKERAELQNAADELARRLMHEQQILGEMPADIPAISPIKTVFHSLPPQMEVLDVRLATVESATTLSVSAEYRGQVAASIVAARWARELSKSVFFSSAKVVAVGGSGRRSPAVVEIEATLNGD
jgi:hypothetical protein